jgi:hypothetical protein
MEEKEDLTEKLLTVLRRYGVTFQQGLYDELVEILEMSYEQGYDQCDEDDK